MFKSVHELAFLSSFTGADIINKAFAIRYYWVWHHTGVQVFDFYPLSATAYHIKYTVDRIDNYLDQIAPHFVNINEYTGKLSDYPSTTDLPMWESADAVYEFLGIERIRTPEYTFYFGFNAQWLFDLLRVLDQLKMATVIDPPSLNSTVRHAIGKTGFGSTWEEAEADYLTADWYDLGGGPNYASGQRTYYIGDNPVHEFSKSITDSKVFNKYGIDIPAVPGHATLVQLTGIPYVQNSGTFAPSPHIPEPNVVTVLHQGTIDENGGRFEISALFPDGEFDSMPEPPEFGHGTAFDPGSIIWIVDGRDGWPQLTGV